MDNPTRWNRVVNKLFYDTIPFNYISRARIITKNNVVYEIKTEVEFINLLQHLKKQEKPDDLEKIYLEYRLIKLRKDVEKNVKKLLSKFYTTN